MNTDKNTQGILLAATFFMFMYRIRLDQNLAQHKRVSTTVCLIWITEIHPHDTDIFKIKTHMSKDLNTKKKQTKTKKWVGWGQGWDWLQ